jgi:hypothetical protein
MTTFGLIVLGLMLGAVAAASHLVVTGARARLVVDGRPGLALWVLPLSFVGPALCVIGAAAAGAVAAWSVIPGLVVTRQLILKRVKEA